MHLNTEYHNFASTGINIKGGNLMWYDLVNCQEFVCIPRIAVICDNNIQGAESVDERQRKYLLYIDFSVYTPGSNSGQTLMS